MLLAPEVARAAAPDLVDDEDDEAACVLGNGNVEVGAVEVSKIVVGPIDVVPSLLTGADVVRTEEKTTTEVDGSLVGEN